jgi:CarboxypepD_reg-like domain
MLHRIISALLLLFSFQCAIAQHASVSGYVKNLAGKPIDSAIIAYEAIGGQGTYVYADKNGFYTIEVPAEQDIALIFAFPGYETYRKKMRLQAADKKNVDGILTENNELNEHVVKGEFKRNIAGNIKMLEVASIPFVPGTIGGVEGLIKIATGSHNELTSQYAVRGGSFDENLVYVNDFEIYRPFLVRSGQQEGLSFVNSDLVQNVNFSVGGFEARYGDKMSSVLDVTYKKPEKFAGSVTTSLLGAALHLEGASKNKKLTYLFGARQKSNQYLLQAQPTQGVYNPSFTDMQGLLAYRLNDSWEFEAIGNYAINRFTFFPESQTTSFGVLNQSYQLRVFYSGSELDQFDSRLGGISATWHKTGARLKLRFLASGFQTNEFETYDITGEYLFGELQTDMSQSNFGQIKTYLGTGLIQDFARNYLTVNVGDVGFRGTLDLGKHYVLFGSNAAVTHIAAELHEWERRDSAAFTQPYDPNSLHFGYVFNSTQNINYNRFNGFIQDNIRFDDAGRFTAVAGVRYNYTMLNSEFIVSPRINLALQPHWHRDWIFKLSTGSYAQPPMYREMVDFNGNVNTALKAQQSYQLVAGGDNNFRMYNRPFKLTIEGYYKNLWNMDPYVYNNVQIKYTGKNDGVGDIYGIEMRLYGDLVKDATSWVSIGVMQGRQKITDSASLSGYNGYFPLPSDQRFMLGMYFEDYLRKKKNYKVHINMMYASGLPTGAPWGHLYQNSLRLPDYKRVDIGFSALLLDSKRREHPANSFFNNIKSIWASLEVFNLLDIQNTLSYSWIQDDTSQKTFAVPNRLTSRLLNLKLLFMF